MLKSQEVYFSKLQQVLSCQRDFFSSTQIFHIDYDLQNNYAI